MSTTNIDVLTRAALWNVYDKKCLFCKQPLEWNDLEIDHIIPEYLGDTQSELQKVIDDYGLRATFTVNDLLNLVPAHVKCNSSKSATLFDKATILYYHGITKHNLADVEEEIEKLKRTRQRGITLSKLQTALAAGLITPDELDRISQAMKEEKWSAQEIKLPMAVDFIGEVYDTFYLNGDLAPFYDKKLLVGGVFDSLSLYNDLGEEVKVSTLREWQHASSSGFNTRDNASLKMSFVFDYLENLLNAISSAKMPKLSFIRDPWIDITNPDNLSPKILIDIEKQLQSHIDAGKSIGDLVREGIVSVNGSSASGIALVYEGFETTIREQFRADFNSDRIEDIFVQGWTRAIGGTLGYGFSGYLTRFSPKGPLDYVR